MYRRFADTLSAGLPKCFGAVVDKDAWFTIVLEDLTALNAYCTGQLEGELLARSVLNNNHANV